MNTVSNNNSLVNKLRSAGYRTVGSDRSFIKETESGNLQHIFLTSTMAAIWETKETVPTAMMGPLERISPNDLEQKLGL